MSDIVKRLRERNFSVFDGIERRMSDPLSGEAADEIERLRAALNKIADPLTLDEVTGIGMQRAVRTILTLSGIARAAVTTSQRANKGE